MKPRVICHMASSLDGRTLLNRWRPEGAVADGVFAKIYESFGETTWLVGRVTGSEYAKRGAYSVETSETFPREPWFSRRDVAAWGVILDAHGKIAWGRSDIEGDPILIVLTEGVPDTHLAGLRSDGVSYIFAGTDRIDLSAALETLERELGVERVLLQGGGRTNGAFLATGLIDEVSLVIFPTIDGMAGGPAVFETGDDAVDVPRFELRSSETLDGGAMWIRYERSEK